MLCVAPACEGTQFSCQDGECIDSDMVCDGTEDCNTGLDEYNCGQVTGKRKGINLGRR